MEATNVTSETVSSKLNYSCCFRIEYFDDMATTADGSSVDTWEPVAFNQKNLHIEGVQIFYDEINTKTARTSTGTSRERTESTASSQVCVDS